MGFSLVVVPGCRWQVGEVPLPTPTPSPTATPTPTPVTLAAAAADVTGAPSENSLNAQVATASADLFAATTSEASKNASNLRDALSTAQEGGESLADNLAQVKKSLKATRSAYLKSEAAVFFVDPDSTAELLSQPDPFGAGSPDGEASALDELQSALSGLEALLDGPLDSSRAADLLVKARSVSTALEKTETGLALMFEAWRPGETANFRAEYFLASSEGAVARIFQGLMAVTGDVLPVVLTAEEQDNAADIASRFAGVRDVYLGKEVSAGEIRPSLHALVERASPLQAALTRASLARAVALASVLEITPDNEAAKSQLSPALQDLTRQLELAANSLGIVIVTED
jgi:hypothetical protein